MGVAALVFVVGGVVFLVGRFGGGFLPGDIVIRRESSTFVFPVVTMVVVSIVLTIVLNLILRR